MRSLKAPSLFAMLLLFYLSFGPTCKMMGKYIGDVNHKIQENNSYVRIRMIYMIEEETKRCDRIRKDIVVTSNMEKLIWTHVCRNL